MLIYKTKEVSITERKRRGKVEMASTFLCGRRLKMRYYLDEREHIPAYATQRGLYYFELEINTLQDGKTGEITQVAKIKDHVPGWENGGTLISDCDILQDGIDAGVICDRSVSIYLEGDKGMDMTEIYGENWGYSSQLEAQVQLRELIYIIPKSWHGIPHLNKEKLDELFRSEQGLNEYAELLLSSLWGEILIDDEGMEMMERVIALLERAGIDKDTAAELKKDFKERIKIKFRNLEKLDEDNRDTEMKYWEWNLKRDYLIYNSEIVLAPRDTYLLLSADDDDGDRITNFLAEKYHLDILLDKENFFQVAGYHDRNKDNTKVYYANTEKSNPSIIIIKNEMVEKVFDDPKNAFVEMTEYISNDKSGDFIKGEAWFLKDFRTKQREKEKCDCKSTKSQRAARQE